MAGINDKPTYYKLARRHELGNTINQWTWAEFMELDCVVYGTDNIRRVAMRGTTPDSSRIQKYDLTVYQACQRGIQAIRDGISPLDILVDEQAPDDVSVLKGEVMLSERHYELRYDMTPGLRMRQAYPIMKHLHGLPALRLIKSVMDAPSWDMLNDIFRRYPDAHVEFTSYARTVGLFGWNTLFWEVRTGY